MLELFAGAEAALAWPPESAQPRAQRRQVLPQEARGTGERDAILPCMTSAVQNRPSAAQEAQETQLRAWLAGIQARDESALGAFYDATVGRVYGLALRITRSRESAEEVAEDVYLQVWRDAARFDPARAGVLGWLLVICRSRALDSLRRADEAQAHPEPETLVPELAHTDQPESLMQAAQDQSALHAALNELSAVQRQLLALAFFRGLTHDEIAAHLGIPLGTVKSHIRRALSALKERLGAGHPDMAKAS
jgi:RNA polymerase sigma factor (sigma-70 family)